MIRVLLFIICYFRFSLCTELNIAEVKEAIYEITIGETPLGFDDNGLRISSDRTIGTAKQVDNNENNIMLTSSYGQRFVCTLPPLPEKKEDIDSSSAQDELSINTVAGVVSAGFYTSKCTKRQFAWWTYEVCSGSEIKQYRAEVTGGVSNMMSLGYFTKNLDIPTFKPKPDRPLYFEQQYLNGSLCDVTGKPRNTIVRFFCANLLETDEVFIDEVDEPATCEYIINVKTGSLCKLNAFLPPEQPRNPLDIKCRPLLEGDEISSYIERKKKEKEEKKAKKAQVDLLYKKAASIQQQRYARERLSLKEPHAAKKAKQIDKRLKKKYEAYVKGAWRLNAELSGNRQKEFSTSRVVLDDFGDVADRYHTTKDEERGYLYWYFKDPFWDNSYFPPTFAYIRALNKFDKLLSDTSYVLKEQDERHEPNVFKRFLQRIEDGLVTEAELSSILGPLSIAFEENLIPKIISDTALKNMEKEESEEDITHKSGREIIEKHLKPFENHVIQSLVDGYRFAPEVVMSKAARDLLSLRNLQERVYKLSFKDPAKMPASYVATEKVFMMYKDAYNRAIKRYDRKEYRLLNGHVIEGFGVKNDNNKIQLKDMHLENARLLYFDKFAHELDEVFPASESGEVWEENRARNRMQRRAKRPNLRKLVEDYFRKPAENEWLVNLPSSMFAKKKNEGSKVLKDLLKNLVKGTGIPEEADISIHFVTVDGEVFGTNDDDPKIANLIKVWLEEQSKVGEEIDRHYNLEKAYAFGATTEQKDEAEGKKEAKRTDLPIIREVI